MVGKRRCSNTDHPSQALWEDFEPEYAGELFSVKYAGRGDLFQNLSIWEEEAYCKLQRTCPVIFLSFAEVKETSFINTREKICQLIKNLYNAYDFLLDGDYLNADEKRSYREISVDMKDYLASASLKMLSDYLMRYYGKKVIILLDEYDLYEKREQVRE